MRVVTLFTALIAFSTVAFAEDKKPSNVYEWFRQLPKASPDVRPVTPEETTALIKRHMAYLLYPVDVASLAPPDKDPKFHDLIAVLQQQMGDPPTGDMTIEEFNRLSEASHNIDGDLIALPLAMVSSIDVNTVFAQGTGSWDNIDRSIDRPINIVHIDCFKDKGMCQEYTAWFNLDGPVLYLGLIDEYQITSWSSSRVTAESHAPCFTDLMTIDIKPQQVTTVRNTTAGLLKLHRISVPGSRPHTEIGQRVRCCMED